VRAAFGALPALQRPSAAAGCAVDELRRTRLCAALPGGGQIAISMILLTGAALLLRSFSSLEQQNMGMETRGVLAAHIRAAAVSLHDRATADGFLSRRPRLALRQLPGVSAVGMSNWLPPAETHEEQIFSNIAWPASRVPRAEREAWWPGAGLRRTTSRR
jgi:putative ABC transport system permease protein